MSSRVRTRRKMPLHDHVLQHISMGLPPFLFALLLATNAEDGVEVRRRGRRGLGRRANAGGARDDALCGPATQRDVGGGRATIMARRAGAGSRATARYVAAPWEARWARDIRDLEGDDDDWARGCAAVAADVDKVNRWLRWIERRAEGRSPPADGEVLSAWADDGGCDGWAPIEPLIGHLRHPLFHCVGPEKDTFALMFSKAFIALPRAAEVGANRPGTKTFFFDAGASVYDECWWGCTKWFVDSYRANGVEFDRILGWEAAAVNHTRFWEAVPRDLKPRFSYYNTPVSADPRSGDNLWHHVRSLAAEADYVVVKLDIDNNPLETALVRQLLADDALVNLVDEFFWEHHVWGSPLRKTRVDLFGTKNIGWGAHMPDRGSADSALHDTYRILTQLREKGVRAHSYV